MTKHDKLEISLTKKMIATLKKGYGKKCKTWDYEDYQQHLNAKDRCANCAAQEVIEWLEEHIKVIKM